MAGPEKEKTGARPGSATQAVAHALRGQELGDGVVFRASAKVLKESGMFDPPLETAGGKYAAK